MPSEITINGQINYILTRSPNLVWAFFIQGNSWCDFNANRISQTLATAENEYFQFSTLLSVAASIPFCLAFYQRKTGVFVCSIINLNAIHLETVIEYDGRGRNRTKKSVRSPVKKPVQARPKNGFWPNAQNFPNEGFVESLISN